MRFLPKFRQLDVPTPGTESTLWPEAAAFFNDLQGLPGWFSPRLANRVWVAERCIQLNAQQIAAMPLKFIGAAPNSVEPSWLSSPDPVWFPNGIGDAVFAIVRAIYGWGYAILYITERYASGFPAGWTVLDSESVSVSAKNGRRVYTMGDRTLDPENVVQIDRNPGGIHGTSALRAYALQSQALLMAAQQGQTNIPTTMLMPKHKITPEQASKLQAQWMTGARSRVNGEPAVLPPDLDFKVLSFSPKDMLLIDAQQFNARVVASAFGVPAFLLNLPMEGSLIYQNPQMLGEFWWRFELRNTAKRVADAFTANMLPRGNAVLFESTDTFAPLTDATNADDSAVISASPADQTGAPIPLRPAMEVMA